MNFERSIKDLTITADRCQRLAEILIDKGDLLKEMAEEVGISLIMTTGDPRVVLEITDIKKLSDVRRVLRITTGSWRDEFRQIWTSGRNVLVAWQNKDNPMFEIWLCTTPEEFPAELKGENCHFEDRVTVDKVLVCR
jgi:hypothetical protein